MQILTFATRTSLRWIRRWYITTVHPSLRLAFWSTNPTICGTTLRTISAHARLLHGHDSSTRFVVHFSFRLKDNATTFFFLTFSPEGNIMKFHQCRLCRTAAPTHVTRRLFFHNKKWCVRWTICVGTRSKTRVKKVKVKHTTPSVNNTDDSNEQKKIGCYLWSCNCLERIHRKWPPKRHCPVGTPDCWRWLNFETQRRSVWVAEENNRVR